MTAGGFLFFGLFAAVQVGMYLAIRRGWLSMGMITGGGVALSLILAMLMSVAQGNTLGHALLVGVLFGGVICGLTLVLAWYFQRQSDDTTLSEQS